MGARRILAGRVVSHLNVCFHGVGTPGRELEPGEDPYWVTRDAFLAIVDELATWPSVRISFDDGNASDVEIGLPALVERDLRADFFVLAGRLGAAGSLDAAAVRELREQGMTIGSHGMAHRSWRAMDPSTRDAELVTARERLAEVAGVARALELGGQRRVDEAVGQLGGADGGLREAGEQEAHGDGRARVGVQARQLARGVKARELVVPDQQAPLRVRDRVLRVFADHVRAARAAEAVERRAVLVLHAVRGASRIVSRPSAGSATAATLTISHGVLASVPWPIACATPSSHASAVKRCSTRQRLTPMRARQ